MKNEMKLSGRAVGDRSRKPQRKVQHPGTDEEASTHVGERYKISNHAELPRHWSDRTRFGNLSSSRTWGTVQGLERRLGNRQLTRVEQGLGNAPPENVWAAETSAHTWWMTSMHGLCLQLCS